MSSFYENAKGEIGKIVSIPDGVVLRDRSGSFACYPEKKWGLLLGVEPWNKESDGNVIVESVSFISVNSKPINLRLFIDGKVALITAIRECVTFLKWDDGARESG